MQFVNNVELTHGPGSEIPVRVGVIRQTCHLKHAHLLIIFVFHDIALPRQINSESLSVWAKRPQLEDRHDI